MASQQAYDQHRDQLLASGPLQQLAVKALLLHARGAAQADPMFTPAEALHNIKCFLERSVKRSAQNLTPPVMRDLLAPSGMLSSLKHFGEPGNDLTARERPRASLL